MAIKKPLNAEKSYPLLVLALTQECEQKKEEGKKYEAETLIRNYLTDRRREQYKKGELTKEKAIELALARRAKQCDKALERSLERLENIANAETLKDIQITVLWKRNRTWGWNPTATVYVNDRQFIGSASGCGYDKESAAIANALYNSYSVLKALCIAKEKALESGKSLTESNRNILGYGSGYGIIPALEGGVGTNCHLDIFKDLGYKTCESHSKSFDSYFIIKE